MEKHYIFNMPRAGWGYEVGDEVTPEFAKARPYAVKVVLTKTVKAEPEKKGDD